MKRHFKIFMTTMVIVALVIVNFPAVEVSAFDWKDSDQEAVREYENPYSNGMIDLLKKENNLRVKYYQTSEHHDTVVEFLDIEMIKVNTVMIDVYGTVFIYCYAGELYQLYYYNKDINKSREFELLLDDEGNGIYSNSLYDYYVNNNKTLTIFGIVNSDGSIGEFTPDFEMMKAQYDGLYPNRTPEPDPTAKPTETPEATIVPTKSPEPTAEPSKAPDPTAEPTKTPELTPEPAPTVEPTKAPDPTESPESTIAPTKMPELTQAPVPTLEPSKEPDLTPTVVPSKNSDLMSTDIAPAVIRIEKSGNEVWIKEGDQKIIAKMSFNKKKGIANFQIGESNKKVKNLKQAFIIENSYNYGYINKKGKFATIDSETGKVTKYSGKWKKAIIKNNVATKIVKAKGGKKKSISGF